MSSPRTRGSRDVRSIIFNWIPDQVRDDKISFEILHVFLEFDICVLCFLNNAKRYLRA